MDSTAEKPVSVGWVRFPRADGVCWEARQEGQMDIYAVWPVVEPVSPTSDEPITFYLGGAEHRPYVDLVAQRNMTEMLFASSCAQRYGEPNRVNALAVECAPGTMAQTIRAESVSMRSYQFPPGIAAGIVYARDYYVRGNDQYILARGAICIASISVCLYNFFEGQYFNATRDLLTAEGKSLLAKLDALYGQEADLITVLNK